MWFNVQNSPLSEKNTELYRYRNFPVTVDKDRYLIIKPSDETANIIESDFKTLWEWKSYLIEDSANWSGKSVKMDKKTIFKSINRTLTVRPDINGPQMIELNCIDKYGNIISNKNGGNVFIK